VAVWTWLVDAVRLEAEGAVGAVLYERPGEVERVGGRGGGCRGRRKTGAAGLLIGTNG
jgi:hypothetical protein